MNTKDKWTITATIHDEPRRTLWDKVFPNGVVPIKDPAPYQINGPGDQKQMAYLLDLDALSRAQRTQLIKLLSVLWDLTPGEVKAELYGGVAIEAEGITVMVSDMGYIARDPAGAKNANALTLYDGPHRADGENLVSAGVRSVGQETRSTYEQ